MSPTPRPREAAASPPSGRARWQRSAVVATVSAVLATIAAPATALSSGNLLSYDMSTSLEAEPVATTQEVISETMTEFGPQIDSLDGAYSWLSSVQSCDVLNPRKTTTLDEVVATINATAAHQRGIDGSGVDIAVIDTGVMPVSGLEGRTVEGIDLSFDHRVDAMRGKDLHGHGTAMASLAASRGGIGGDGVAPDARIVDVRVGAGDGSVDVSQVIAAIDWVIANKDTDGRNIRVLSLSYNTDGIQPYEIDPLTHAVENAWRAGIVVVVAGGNDGRSIGHLGNPATNPFVIAVGATRDTGSKVRTAPWSSIGDGTRNPDVVAPGQQVLAGGVPGSYLASRNSDAVCAAGRSMYIRGSGTSQAAAVTAGAAALLLEARPELTPDQVKYLFTSTARELQEQERFSGNGLIDVDAALAAPTPGAEAVQSHARSTGLGSLEAARGTMHVLGEDGTPLTGEMTVFGTAWNPVAWAAAADTGSAWTGAPWTGATWSGATWSGATWSGATWSGATWSGATWSGATWSGATWSGATWSGAGWTGASWTGASWTGASWTGASWT